MENGINKISAYGDSILKGAVTGTGSGHLFDIIEDSSLVLASKSMGFELNNNSVFGSVVSKTQRRLNRDLEKGIECDLAIIESGGNDCDYDWAFVSGTDPKDFGTLAPRTTLAEFIRMIDEMVKSVRAARITPLIMTMPPLVGDWWFDHICEGHDKENILKFVEGSPYRLYQNHELYANALFEYALKNGVQVIDMRQAMLAAPNYRNLMCKDGIHPNEEGYKYMAKIWEEKLPDVKKEF